MIRITINMAWDGLAWVCIVSLRFELKQKNKKLIGTIIIPIWLLFFLSIISSLGEIIIPRLSNFETFVFYFIGGIIWIFPIMPLISWMQKEKS